MWELAALLAGTLPSQHPYAQVRLQPEVSGAPELWLLGSSDYSGALAAQLGVAFSFAHFINPRGGDQVMRDYRESFKAGHEPAPRTMVCTFAICGEDDGDAERLAAAIDLRRLHMALNVDSPVPTQEAALAHRYSSEEGTYVASQRSRAVIGGPAKCRREIEAMAGRYGADEVMVLTITGDYASRMRSYERLIAAF